MAEDPVGDQPGLAGALGRQHKDLILHARIGAAAVLRAAEPDGVVGSAREQAGQVAEAWPGTATVRKRRQAAPAEYELEQGRIPRARAKPEPGTPAQRPGPAADLGGAAEVGPVEQDEEDENQERRADDKGITS